MEQNNHQLKFVELKPMDINIQNECLTSGKKHKQKRRQRKRKQNEINFERME